MLPMSWAYLHGSVAKLDETFCRASGDSISIRNADRVRLGERLAASWASRRRRLPSGTAQVDVRRVLADVAGATSRPAWSSWSDLRRKIADQALSSRRPCRCTERAAARATSTNDLGLRCYRRDPRPGAVSTELHGLDQSHVGDPAARYSDYLSSYRTPAPSPTSSSSSGSRLPCRPGGGGLARYPDSAVSATTPTHESHFDAERVTVIKPRRGWASLDLRELWDYRELLYFLVWRDVKIRYKQTALGAGWVILQPLLTTAIFTIIFGHYAHIPTNGVPYPLLTFTAILPWMLFANALALSTKSIVENQALVTKVYVPRILIPVAPVLAGLVDMAVGFVVLFGLMVWYGVDAALADRDAAVLHPVRGRDLDRRHALVLGAEREVPRRPVHGAVPLAGVVLHHARRLLGAHLPAGDPPVDRPQPDGRRRAGVPLVDPRHAGGAGRAPDALLLRR